MPPVKKHSPRIASPASKNRPRSDKAPTSVSPDLAPLFEFSKVVNSSLDLTFILGTVLLTVMGKMLVSKGWVLLKRSAGMFEIVSSKGVSQDFVGKHIHIDNSFRSTLHVDRASKQRHSWLDLFVANGFKVLIPITTQGKIVGALALAERLAGRKYTRGDLHLIDSLVSLSGSAIEKTVMIDQLKNVNRNLDRKFQEFNTLFDLSKEFNVVLDTDKLVRLLTFSLLGQIGVSRYAICLKEGESLRVAAARMEGDLEKGGTFKQLAEVKTASLMEDLLHKKRTREMGEQLSRLGFSAVIPMQIQNQAKGVILLGERLRGGEYSKADLEFLYSLANLAIISIENARLFKEAIEKQKLEDELAIAREIQQGLLPRTLPSIPYFEIAAVNVPSTQVGGDYYDVLQRSATEFIIAIGDVSGKGTPAALLMANAQAALRAIAPMGLPLPQATARLNDLTCTNTSQSKFITFFWGVIDAEKRRLCYVNAGHNPPILVRTNGLVERLEAGGIILGIMKTAVPYAEGSVEVGSGDMLVLYTDGVSEAMNAEGIDFGDERFEQLVKDNRTLTTRGLIERVRQELEAYTRGTPQSDDITMLVLKAL